MTTPRDPDAKIAAFFEARQPDLPDRAFDAVRRDIHRTRQLVVLGRLREPDHLLGARFVAAAIVVLAVGIAFLELRPGFGPVGAPSPASSPTAVPSPAVSPSPVDSPSSPTVFTSSLYGYTITIPAGWVSTPAITRWDGKNQPGPDADTDKFGGPEQLSVFGFAGPFRGNLAAFVLDRITATARDHADTCPVAEPEINERLQIGGQQWVLLGWNCGAVINIAVTVRNGVGYVFTFRDLAVQAATDPVDRAIFRAMLDSIELPT
jgi:hypothetical protein